MASVTSFNVCLVGREANHRGGRLTPPMRERRGQRSSRRGGDGKLVEDDVRMHVAPVLGLLRGHLHRGERVPPRGGTQAPRPTQAGRHALVGGSIDGEHREQDLGSTEPHAIRGWAPTQDH